MNNIGEILLILGTECFLFCLVLVFSHVIFSHVYKKNDKVYLMNIIIEDISGSFATFIIGILILAYPEWDFEGIWQSLIISCMIVGLVYISLTWDKLPKSYYRFVIIHHLLSILFMVIWTIITLLKVVNSRVITPFALIWNASTLYTAIEYFWYTSNCAKGNIIGLEQRIWTKLAAVLLQNIHRIILWACSITIPHPTIAAIILTTIAALGMQIYNIQDQTRSILKLYKKKIENDLKSEC